MRTVYEQFAGKLQNFLGLSAGHRGEGIEELVQAVAGFEMVPQTLDGYPCAGKYGRS
jgi:hypothetical protein